ncbi:tRNA-uridine aminocarboxypropyltransferase 1 isoform X2 [Venturia canescens]|nr:tRNA-uridine aminocarboxypropyltransferase 1 isoform X2 [Venturia canescens]XP_043269624.1 tRNA-uridine aminocarboxypropyltransferase 1 isoform X2 [Venturia canescens]
MAINQELLVVLQEKQKVIDREPFRNFRIDDPKILDCVEGREICGKCYKSRKFFCYTCYSPVIDQKYFPRVKLPIKIDIIKHAREIDGKSTAIHAAILAPDDVRIYTYPEFPEFLKNERIVLIFPSDTATTVEQLCTSEYRQGIEYCGKETQGTLPITRAVFIDSTWHQTKAIYKDQRLRDLPCVILKSRISQFWRHQKKSPRWYLATIEAIHQFMVELHECAFATTEDHVSRSSANSQASLPVTKPYSGEYDNLLYFFKYMYEKIHTIYDHDKLWAYKRPLL